MTGYVRVKIGKQSNLVRFEQIDRPNSSGKFDRLRDDFYQMIPSAKWNPAIKWMIVPNHDLGKVLEFCYRRFEPVQVKVAREVNHDPQPIQLGFNL